MSKYKSVLILIPVILVLAVLEIVARFTVLPNFIRYIYEWSVVVNPLLILFVYRNELKTVIKDFKDSPGTLVRLNQGLIPLVSLVLIFFVVYLRIKDEFTYLSSFQSIFVKNGNSFQLLGTVLIGLGLVIKTYGLWEKIFEIAKYFFGSYSLPKWIVVIPQAIKWSLRNKKQVAIACVTYALIAVFFGFFIKIKISPNQVITDAVQDSKVGKKHEKKIVSIYYNAPSQIYFYKSGDKVEAQKGSLSISFDSFPFDLDKKVKIEEQVVINPPIAGKWEDISDTKVSFTPDGYWVPGEKYTVRVNSENLKSNTELKNKDFDFEIDRYSLRITNRKFYVNPKDASEKRVVVKVQANYPIEKKSLQKKIEFVVKNHKGKHLKKLKGKVSLDEIGTTAYIHSDDFGLRNKSQVVDIKIASGVDSSFEVKGTKDEEDSTIDIPSKYSFMNIDIRDLSIERDPKDDIPYHSFHILANTELEEKAIFENLEIYELPRYDDGKIKTFLERYYGTSWNRCFRYVRNDRSRIQITWSSCDNDSKASVSKWAPKKTASFIEKKYLDPKKFELTFDTEVGKYYLIKLKAGFQSKQGYTLKKDLINTTQAPEFPKEIKLANRGSVVSLNGSHKVSVYTRGITTLNYRLKQLLPNQIQHILSMTDSDKMNPRFENYYFTADNITQKFEGEIPLAFDLKKGGYTNIDLTSYLDNRSFGGDKNYGIFFLELLDENKRSFHKQIIFVSDMAYIMKKDTDGDRQMYILSSSTGSPISGVKVKKVFTNGITKRICTTGADGHCTMGRNTIDGKGFILQKGNDILFSRFSDYNNEVNFSRFDIGGEYNYGDSVKAYVFSDRKLYRPGESAWLGMILKDKEWSSDYEGEWLKVEVTDPRGTIFLSDTIQVEQFGYQSLKIDFPYIAPTGDYRVKVSFRGSRNYYSEIGSYTLKVQEFLPDKLKIAVNFNQNYEHAWVPTKDLKGLVSLRNLFGNAAIGNRVLGKINLSPKDIFLPKFRDYSFSAQETLDYYKELELTEAKTDESGQVNFDFDLEPYKTAQFKLEFVAEGFMKSGGRSVIGKKSIMVSNAPYLVGLQLPQNRYFITKKVESKVKMVAVNSLQKAIEVSGLKLSIYEKKYQNTLVKQADGTFAYQDTKEPILHKKLDLKIAAGGSDYTIENTKVGEFIAKIETQDGKVLHKFDYTVVGEAELARSLAQSAELKLKLSKDDYKPGETAVVNVKAPYKGYGLITVERDKIYAKKWFRLDKPTGNISIQVPEGIEGNAYINVSMLRDSASTKVFTAPYTYGVANFTIDKSKRRLEIDIEAPLNVKPGEKVKIRYKTNRQANIVLYGADQGILQLAQYKKPNPLSHFFRKQALQVTTYELFSLILPEYEMVKKAFAAGGGFGAKGGKNINPFKRKFTKAVAFWSDIVASDTDWSEYEYEVPSHFNGTLKVYAVAVNDEAIGVQQRKVFSKDDIIISPTVPTFLAPGDKVELSATITNNLPGNDKKDDLKVTVALSDGLKLVGNASSDLSLEKNRDEVVRFKAVATEKLGNAKVEFFVDHKKGRSRYEENLSVRPLNPYIRRSWRSMLSKGDVSLKVDGAGYFKEFFSGEITLTSGFWALIKGGIRNLAKYPYGCSEQITSKAVPYLYFTEEDLQINPNEKKEFLAKTFSTLLERQNSDGSLKLYPSGYRASDYVNLYIAKFLIRAKQKNIAVPEILYTRLMGYLNTIIENSSDVYRANALYLLALAEEQVGAKLKIFTKEQYKNDLVNLYLAGIYNKLEDEEKALKYLKKVNKKFKNFKTSSHYYNSSTLNNLYVEIVSENFPDKMKEEFDERVQRMVDTLTRYGTNSLVSAQIIMALNDYAGERVLKGIPINVTYRDDTKEKTIDSAEIKTLAKEVANIKKIDFELPENKKYFFALDIFGFNKNLKAFNKGVQIRKRVLDQDGNEVKEAKIGEELIVELAIQADSYVEDAVVVDLLPGGFDLVWKKWEDSNFTSDVSQKFVDNREDRVILYTSADTDLKKYYYKIKAVSKVDAQVPGSYFENMYKTKEQALSPLSKINVKE